MILLPAPLSLPAAAALIQLRKVWSPNPSSFTTAVIESPFVTRFDGKLFKLGRACLFRYLFHFTYSLLMRASISADIAEYAVRRVPENRLPVQPQYAHKLATKSPVRAL